MAEQQITDFDRWFDSELDPELNLTLEDKELCRHAWQAALSHAEAPVSLRHAATLFDEATDDAAFAEGHPVFQLAAERDAFLRLAFLSAIGAWVSRIALSHAEGEAQPAAMLRGDLRQLYVDMLNADVHAETAGESFGLGRCITASHLERFAALLENGVVPSEHGKNRFGLDMSYFRNAINRELNRPLTDYRPDELAREHARLSRTADLAVMHEPEFGRSAPQVAVPEGYAVVPVEPTNEMQEAGGRAIRFETTTMNKLWTGNKVYAAMLAAAPTAPAGEPAEIPEIGSRWRHRDGHTSYTVEAITNESTERPEQYPVTIVYRGGNGKLWSRPAHDWHRSMTFESAPEQPVSDPDGPTLTWDKPMTSKQAGRYLLTNGFVAVELYRADVQRLEKRIEELESAAPDEREIAAQALDDFMFDVAAWVRLLSDSDQEARVLRKVNGWLHSRAKRLRAGKEGE